MIKKAIRL